jgi:hypothetical protein
VTKPIREMTQEELSWAVEGYAAGARLSFDKGEDPTQTLNRIRSMLDHYSTAPDTRAAGSPDGAFSAAER